MSYQVKDPRPSAACPFCGKEVQPEGRAWNKTFCSTAHKKFYWAGIYRAARDVAKRLRSQTVRVSP